MFVWATWFKFLYLIYYLQEFTGSVLELQNGVGQLSASGRVSWCHVWVYCPVLTCRWKALLDRFSALQYGEINTGVGRQKWIRVAGWMQVFTTMAWENRGYFSFFGWVGGVGGGVVLEGGLSHKQTDNESFWMHLLS